MTDYLKVLNAKERDQLIDAISLITVYIAGADGNFDEDEVLWAEKLTKIRSYSLPERLSEFYQEVGIDFHERIQKYAIELRDIEVRNSTVRKKLTDLNPVLAKLDPKFGAMVYDSLLSFAKHVAKSSGGFLGFFSIGAKESALLGLEMITPIVWED